MADLVCLVPSRGRPKNIARLARACEETCEAGTILHFGFDSDDPELPSNLLAAGGALFTTADRMPLGHWTNHLASFHPRAPFVCSIGDDMVPETPGWDRLLIEAAAGGMSYPEGHRGPEHGRAPGIPEMIVMDSRIVRALGWVCEPSLGHWYVDNVWRDLGEALGCLRFCPDVSVRHLHPNVPGGDPGDATYADAGGKLNADLTAYQRWRMKRMLRDIETARRAVA